MKTAKVGDGGTGVKCRRCGANGASNGARFWRRMGEEEAGGAKGEEEGVEGEKDGFLGENEGILGEMGEKDDSLG